MKNILVLLLMIMLPLQASWSAAAVFCQHETTLSGHWGHHQHEPDASCSTNASNADQQGTQLDNTQLDKQSSSSDFSVKHKLNLASHSDHLNVNQQAIKQQDAIDPQLQQSTYAMIFAALPLVFYQSPILEQPEPPLWSA